MRAVELRCDMRKECTNEVTHIDEKGFIYCKVHGQFRKNYMRCRQMSAKEIAQIKAGKPLGRYERTA